MIPPNGISVEPDVQYCVDDSESRACTKPPLLFAPSPLPGPIGHQRRRRPSCQTLP